jgi:hypothetical protein
MKRFLIGSMCAVVGAAWLSSAPVVAQGGGAPAAAVETPRDAEGHPVLAGIWANTLNRTDTVPENYASRLRGRLSGDYTTQTDRTVNFERDSGIGQRVLPYEAKPWYNPRSWERVKFYDVHGHNVLAPDPTFQCMPAGVPRAGLPREIVETDSTLYFLYQRHQRRIYIDGRPHPPIEAWLGTWFGHSIGHWEGDTLVVSTVDFNGAEWMGWPGYFTSPDKTVIERFTRVGDTLTLEATVTDESLLLQPWSKVFDTAEFNNTPQGELEEPLPCLERDIESMATRERG